MIFHLIFIIGMSTETLLKNSSQILNLDFLKKKKDNPKRSLKKVFTSKFLNRSFEYLKLKYSYNIIKDLFSLILLLLFIYSGLFINMSLFFSQHFTSPLLAHLLFLGSVSLFFYLIFLPFQIIDTFHIEKRFEFSTITVKIFILDQIKVLLLSGILGGLLLSGLFLFILKFKETWWIWAWIFFTLFSLLIIKIFPSFIAPLFNKFKPIKDKKLKNSIMAMAQKAQFSIKNILENDASKRSKHSNAYFTGMGKNKQIVLFDTLLKQLNTREITSVLAHEIGHFKFSHIWKMFIIQTLITGMTLFLVKLLTHNNLLLTSFDLIQAHYLTQFIFSLLFLNSFFWILQFPMTILSRKHEFQADLFAKEIIKNIKSSRSALIKLTKDNLSNPYPHPLYSWLYYSHPPLIERINHLEKISKLKKS